MPRAELLAAVLNASTSHIVSKAFGSDIVNRTLLTDSQIVLFWISNSQLPLKKWVRNRVIEINRLTDRKQWYFVEGKNNVADLGTRKGATVNDIQNDNVVSLDAKALGT